MITNTTQIFSKIEVLVKNNISGILSTTKMNFTDSGLTLSGNYLIITVYEKNEKNETITKNDVYELNNIKAYKTYEK